MNDYGVEMVQPGTSESDRKYESRNYMVYFIFFLAGMGTLLPWNFFITAFDHFENKLGNGSSDGNKTREQVLFASNLSLCAMLPLAAFNLLSLLIMHWISSFARFTAGAILILIMFVVTVILVWAPTTPHVFLGLTLVSVVLINSGSALSQGGLIAIASVLPSDYIKAVMEGQAIAGVVASFSRILSLMGSSDLKTNATAYFCIAIIFIGLAIVGTLMMRSHAYFQYHWSGRVHDVVKVEPNGVAPMDDTTPTVGSKMRQIVSSVREVSTHAICAFLVLMMTLSVFPALLNPVRSKYYDDGDPWTTRYFTPVIIFLSFNVFDWLGRFFAGVARWPRREQKVLLLLLTILRLALIPYCLLLNQVPKKNIPALLVHDAFPIIFVIILGFTNGYLLTLTMMYGPSFASKRNTEGAGLVLALSISLGLAMGVAISAGFASIIFVV